MKRVLGLAAAVMVVVAAASAEERVVRLLDVTVVQDGEGSARIFFRVAVPFSENTLVERAVLTMPFTGSAAERELELRICPVTQAWGTPSWETPVRRQIIGSFLARI